MTAFLSLEDAAELVTEGMTIALGGMTLYRRPVAFVRALLRRQPRPRDLTLLSFTAGFEADLLIGAGCVRSIRSCYVGLEAFGFAPMFTERANRGELHIIEETEASLAMGLRARMSGIGFMPSRAWLGTDLPRLRPDVKTIIDPYTGEMLMAFPALSCNLAILHGLEGDDEGNISLNHNLGVDMELAYAAEQTLVTVERRVERIQRQRDSVILPSPGVTYMALAPRGAFPTSCYPDYPLAGRELMAYVDACSAGQFDAYVERLIAD